MADDASSGPQDEAADSLLRSASMEPDSMFRAVAAAPPRRVESLAVARLEPGTVVGATFRVESVLGAGAMGVVYLATDVALDRRVALKLHASAEGDVQTSRMWREAKAMARLSDPNVIAVHEVGVHDGRVFIAMELVDGGPASDWLTTARGWPEVLDAFTQAARGLAAAHREGIVHRDFKASNMLIGRDGRVRVADFGLARAATDRGDALASTTSGVGVGSGSGASLDDRLTETGMAVGTPVYMAPEQFDGHVDHRSDQYSLCVALHEALWGVRPFGGNTVRELRAAIEAGRVRPPPDDRQVPAWLRAVVLQGLRPRPEDRFVDMDALVRALQSDPTRLRRRRVAIAGTTTVLLGLSGVIAYQATRDRGGIDCDDRAALLGVVWDDAARRSVEAGVLGTGVSYAADSWARIEPGLDAWADGWARAAQDACAGIDAPVTEALRSAQALCLDQRKQAFGALVGVLADADAKAVERAVTAIGALPAVAPCRDVAYLAARVPPPADPTTAAAVEDVRAQLLRAGALEQAGGFAAGLEIAGAALERAQGLDYGPVLAEASLRVGTLEDATGKYGVAEQRLRESYAEAIAVGDDGIAAEAASRLVLLVGDRLARHDDGLEWGFHAMAEVRRVGLGDRREASLLSALGGVHQARGEYDQALDYQTRALAIDEASLGPEHVEVARIVNNLGAVHRLRGDYVASIAAHQRALELRERVLGPEHPAIASTLLALGAAYYEKGERDRAIEVTRRALGIRERALGPDHPELAPVLANLGAFLERAKDYDGALASLQRGLAIELAALGPDHPNVATTTEIIGNVYLARGQIEAAAAEYRKVLEIRERALGPDHPDVGKTLGNLGIAYSELGRHDEALALYRRELAIEDAALGADHPLLAGTHDNIGSALLDLGQYDESMVERRRALEIRLASFGPDDPRTANSYMNLANVHEAKGELAPALELDLRALAVVERAYGTDDPRIALALYNVGQARLALGDARAAVSVLERALALRERSGTRNELADVRFLLAQALEATNAHERARGLAVQAQGGYDVDAGALPLRDKVTVWLEAHGG